MTLMNKSENVQGVMGNVLCVCSAIGNTLFKKWCLVKSYPHNRTLLNETPGRFLVGILPMWNAFRMLPILQWTGDLVQGVFLPFIRCVAAPPQPCLRWEACIMNEWMNKWFNCWYVLWNSQPFNVSLIGNLCSDGLQQPTLFRYLC